VKSYDYVEHNPMTGTVFKIDGHVIGQTSQIATHTLKRWLRKARKVVAAIDTKHPWPADLLAVDIARVLAPKKENGRGPKA
jgi:hypothetical protein